MGKPMLSFVICTLAIMLASCAVATVTPAPTTTIAVGALTNTSVPPPGQNVANPPTYSEYPSNWPINLRYPAEFKLLQANSQIFANQGNIGLGAELHFLGNLDKAFQTLSKFLLNQGWTVTVKENLSADELFVIFEDSQTAKQGSYSMKVDSDDPSRIIVIALLIIK